MVGAGVVGLTTAVRLAEAGRSVLVRARELPSETTSFAAGAMWWPLWAAHERVPEWSEQTLRAMREMADDPRAGIQWVSGLEAARFPTEPPELVTRVDGFVRCDAAELPDGFVSGWRYTVPVVNMPRYLAYLQQRLVAAGGRIELGEVGSLADPSINADVVINCTGIGARTLVPDGGLVPVRGQLVVVRNPGIDQFFAEYGESTADGGSTPELTYILPQGDHVILGGTAEKGRSDSAADPDLAAAIVRRCAAIEPTLLDALVIGHRIGLRPDRGQVRLELVDVGDRKVIHNYGHGGGGVTLSWGCASDIVAMVLGLD